jgi:hypothetical protein
MPVVTISGRGCWRVSSRRPGSSTFVPRDRLCLFHIPQEQGKVVVGRLCRFSLDSATPRCRTDQDRVVNWRARRAGSRSSASHVPHGRVISSCANGRAPATWHRLARVVASPSTPPTASAPPPQCADAPDGTSWDAAA